MVLEGKQEDFGKAALELRLHAWWHWSINLQNEHFFYSHFERMLNLIMFRNSGSGEREKEHELGILHKSHEQQTKIPDFQMLNEPSEEKSRVNSFLIHWENL